MTTGPHHRPRGEYSKVLRDRDRRTTVPPLDVNMPTPPTTPVLEAADEILQLVIEKLQPNKSVAAMTRTQNRYKKGIVGLTGISSLLLAIVGILVSYIRGYGDYRVEEARVQEQRADLDAKISAHLEQGDVYSGPSNEDFATVLTLTEAVSKLQLEQQDYFVDVLAAISARRKVPEKPNSLVNAEDAVRKAMKKP